MIYSTSLVTQMTGSNEIISVIGGLHIRDASDLRLKKTVEHLRQYPLEIMAPTHCSGLKGKCTMLNSFPETFRDIGVGSILTFNGESEE